MSDPVSTTWSTPTLSPMIESMLRLLAYSWRDIDFQYDGLTSEEKECCSPEEHQSIVAILIERGLTNPRTANVPQVRSLMIL